MNSITKNTWFWLLQLIGWGFIAGINTWGKLMSKIELSKLYIYLEGFGFLLSGIITTLVVRKYLKKHLSFDKFQSNEIKTIFLAWFLGTIIFYILLLSFSYLTYYRLNNTIPEVNNLQHVSTILNSFIFILFWILFYLSIKISRQFRKNKIEKLELESSLKESQLNTLIGQINPHFMFNSLNNIRGLMLEDIDKSREMITRLSDMLRYSLTKTSQDKITISQELEMVDNYIALSKIQLEDRLIFKKEIDNSLLEKEIPPMIIQMLIENAIKHGVSNLTKGGIVQLQIQAINNLLIITVINPGKLKNKINSTKVGIENIKKRLNLLFGAKGIFNLSEIENQVIAKITIPLADE